MNIRALKTTSGSYGLLARGMVADVEEYEARELIAQGYAIEELPLDKQEAANDNDPFAVGQNGSRTGADPLRSLLLEDQARPQPELSAPRAGQESASLPSTTDINSARGPMPSTPATTTGGKRKRGRRRSQG